MSPIHIVTSYDHPCYIVHLLRSYQNDTLRHTNDDRYGLNDATNEDEDEKDAIRTVVCTAASSFDIVLNMSFTHFALLRYAADISAVDPYYSYERNHFQMKHHHHH